MDEYLSWHIEVRETLKVKITSLLKKGEAIKHFNNIRSEAPFSYYENG